MIIVGVGAAPGMLTEMAIEAIKNAKVIYGSKRSISIASRFISCETVEIDFKKLDGIPDDAVVLSTGDPMLSGLGFLGGKIIPGISSLQLASSKLNIPLTDLSIVTAHGRDKKASKETILDYVKRDKNVFIITESGFGPEEIGEFLHSCGYELKITLCENLGYEDERISTGITTNPPAPLSNMFVVVIWGGKDLD